MSLDPGCSRGLEAHNPCPAQSLTALEDLHNWDSRGLPQANIENMLERGICSPWRASFACRSLLRPGVGLLTSTSANQEKEPGEGREEGRERGRAQDPTPGASPRPPGQAAPPPQVSLLSTS